MEDHRLLDAFGAWEELSQTPESIIAFESRLKKSLLMKKKLIMRGIKGRLM